ncbi:hypothetical protein D3C87_2056990 [compost metagenome]
MARLVEVGLQKGVDAVLDGQVVAGVHGSVSFLVDKHRSASAFGAGPVVSGEDAGIAGVELA